MDPHKFSIEGFDDVKLPNTCPNLVPLCTKPFKVHLTPEIFFAQTNPLTVWIIASENFFDLVKTSNFYDLLNLTKVGS